jgi:hypothetical protein
MRNISRDWERAISWILAKVVVADGSNERLWWTDEVYSIGKWNSRPTQTRERLMSVPMTGAEFQAYLHRCSPSAVCTLVDVLIRGANSTTRVK